jgi:hypothetical protein
MKFGFLRLFVFVLITLSVFRGIGFESFPPEKSSARVLSAQPTCNSYLDTISVLLLQVRTDKKTGLPLVPQRELRMSFFPERKEVMGKFDRPETRMLYVLGAPKGPIVYLWNGMGSSANASYSNFIMDMLNAMGMTVVAVPSTFNENDSLGFSTHVRPGLSSSDVSDLLKLTEAAEKEILQRHELIPSSRILMGVSMGAFQIGALLSRTEWEQKFSKYILINPPMDLRFGIQALDRMVDGARDLSNSRKQEIDGFRSEFFSSSDLKEDPAEFRSEVKRRQWGERELGYLIGSSMRSSVQGATLASQLVKNDGVLKRKTSFGRSQEVKKWSIYDYFQKIALPFHAEHFKKQGLALDLEREMTLLPHLREAKVPQNVLVLHALDDFISDPKEMEKLKQLPIQSVITRCGGHVGALGYSLYQEPLREFLRDSANK